MPGLALVFASIFMLITSQAAWRRIGYSTSIVVIFLFLALRMDYGNDYPGYLEIFKEIKEGSGRFRNEPGYYYLNLLVPSFNYIIVISALVSVYAYNLLFKRFSNAFFYISLMWLFTFLNPYHFLHNVSAIRQAIAIALVIFGVLYYLKGKKITYLALIGGASLFHISAIVAFIYPFILILKNVSYRNLSLIFLFLFALSIMPIWQDIFNYSINSLGYQRYLNYIQDGWHLSLRTLILNSLLFAFLFFSRNETDQAKIATVVALVAILLTNISVNLPMVHRVGLYFEFFVPIAIALAKYRCGIFKYILLAYAFLLYSLRFLSFHFIDPTWVPFRSYNIFLFGGF
jgi:hypothetical protein